MSVLGLLASATFQATNKKDTHTHKHTHANKQAHIHTHTRTNTHTQTNRHTHAQTQTQTKKKKKKKKKGREKHQLTSTVPTSFRCLAVPANTRPNLPRPISWRITSADGGSSHSNSGWEGPMAGPEEKMEMRDADLRFLKMSFASAWRPAGGAGLHEERREWAMMCVCVCLCVYVSVCVCACVSATSLAGWCATHSRVSCVACCTKTLRQRALHPRKCLQGNAQREGGRENKSKWRT